MNARLSATHLVALVSLAGSAPACTRDTEPQRDGAAVVPDAPVAVPPEECADGLERALGHALAGIVHEPAGDLVSRARLVAAREREGTLSLWLRAGSEDHRIDVVNGAAPAALPGRDVDVELTFTPAGFSGGSDARLVLRDPGGDLIGWYERSIGEHGAYAAVADLRNAIGGGLSAEPLCLTTGGQCGRRAVRYALASEGERAVGPSPLTVQGEHARWLVWARALADDYDRWPTDPVCAISLRSDVWLDAVPDLRPAPLPACDAPLPLPLGTITAPAGSPPIEHAPAGDLDALGTFGGAEVDAMGARLRVQVGEIEHVFVVPLGSAPPIAPGTSVRARFVDRSSPPTALHWELTLDADDGALLAHYVRAGGVGALDALVAATGERVGSPLGVRRVCRVPGGTCGRPGVQAAIVGFAGEAAQGETLAIERAEGPLSIDVHSMTDDAEQLEGETCSAIATQVAVAYDVLAR